MKTAINYLTNTIKNINVWFLFSFFLCLIVILPIIIIFLNSFNVNHETWLHIYKHLFFEYSLNTFFLVVGVALLTLLLGSLSAWIVGFYNFPLKKAFSFLLIMPIAIPPYAVAYCYADLTDYSAFFSFFPSIRSRLGAIFILSLTLFPYVYLICKNAFTNNSMSILESAANLGADRITLFFKFALPISRPAIVASIALVVMETLADFGVVHYLGVDSLSVGIYKAWFGFDDLGSSSRIASLLFIFSFIIIIAERISRNNKYQRYISYGKSKNNYLYPKATILPMIFIILLLMISLVIPLIWLISSALSDEGIFSKNLLISSFNTLKLGILGSLIIVFSASIVCFYKRQSKNAFTVIYNLVKVGYASPGIVIAIGVMVPILYIDKKINNLFQHYDYEIGLILSSSVFILIVAYLVRFLSVAINPIESSYEKISDKIDFVADNMKASRKKLFMKIHIPMISEGIIVAFLLLFIEIIKELPATLILRPLNFNTLSIYTFEFASSEQLSLAATPALLITALATIPLIFIHVLSNKFEGELR